ncbi:hypothetical protein OC835_004913 [Tilletia horrida]|nr:hypothetical protein OC835_004913 [Tilletia horrida]
MDSLETFGFDFGEDLPLIDAIEHLQRQTAAQQEHIDLLQQDLSNVERKCSELSIRLQLLEKVAGIYARTSTVDPAVATAGASTSPAAKAEAFSAARQPLFGNTADISSSTAGTSAVPPPLLGPRSSAASTTSTASTSTPRHSTASASGSSAAARLSSRFAKVDSTAQGRKTGGPPTTAASASARVKPISFQNGITLIKDRRLIDKMFLTKKFRPVFDAVVDQERLRVRPTVDKDASARETYNIINNAFIQQGHNLVRDGWNGFEFAYVISTDHKLMTLGPKDFPRQELSATELVSEYKRRDCYVVVCSSKKFGPYDPLFFGTDGNIIIIIISDDEEDEDDLPDILLSKTKGKAAEKQSDFEACSTCGSKFSIDVIDDHEASCLWYPELINKHHDKLPGVKQEPGTKDPPSPSEHYSEEEDTDDCGEAACVCGKPDEDEKLADESL